MPPAAAPSHCTPLGRLAALGLLLGLAGAVSSCTAIVLTDTEQCQVSADCAALGPDFATFTCSEEHVCVAGTNSCATAQECIDANDGAPSICQQGSCVQLTSQYCQTVVPESAIGDDNAIVLGWMGPLQGDFASLGLKIERGAELALSEINANQNGLPAVTKDSQRRQLLMVACHDLDDLDAVTNHLVNKVKVPAIIGPAFSGITVKVATDVAIPSGTLLLSASATSPQITDLDDGGLVWRTAPSDALQAIPLADLVSQTEIVVRTAQNLMPTDPIRVVTVAKGDAYGLGLANALTPLIQFNGKSASDNGNNFRPKQYDDPSVNPNFDYAALINDIVQFKPHIVLPLGTNEGITEVMQGIEASWPTTSNPPPRPYYLFPDGGRLDELLAATKSNDNLRLRCKGTVPGRKGDNYNAFAIRYRMAFNSDEPGTFSENAYDAGYLLAYSILAAGNQPTNGSNIASGLTRMSSGPSIVVGPNNINAAYTALTNGTAPSIDFDGASGPLDFDIATGEARSDIDIWCIQIDQVSGEPVFVSSGQFYEATSNSLQGTDTCND